MECVFDLKFIYDIKFFFYSSPVSYRITSNLREKDVDTICYFLG